MRANATIHTDLLTMSKEHVIKGIEIHDNETWFGKEFYFQVRGEQIFYIIVCP
jgi:hypothetical protein